MAIKADAALHTTPPARRRIRREVVNMIVFPPKWVAVSQCVRLGSDPPEPVSVGEADGTPLPVTLATPS